MELTPQKLSEYLTVLRKHNVRAMRMGDLVVELNAELPVDDLIETSDQAQVRWGRPFDMDDPRGEQ